MKNPLRKPFGFRSTNKPEPQQSEGQKLTDGHGLQVTRFPSDYTASLRLYGVSGNYAQLYTRQYNIRTAIDVIAREAATLHMHVYETDPRGKMQPDSKLHLDDHKLAVLLDSPEPGMSKYRFWYGLFADLAVYDVAYWLKVRDRGNVVALLRIPPQNLVPDRDPITSRVRFFRAPGGAVIQREQLVIYWGYDPATAEGSVPPMETLRRLIAEEVASGMDREARWRNSSRKDGIIERDVASPLMNDEAKEGFLIDLEDSTAGPTGSGRPAILQPGMRWNDVQWSPRELEYIEARKLSRTEVAAAFHIPPAMMAAASTGVEPNPETLNYFYSSSLPPWLVRVEHEIEAQLLPEFEITPERRRAVHVEFDLNEKLRGSFEERIKILATATGGPILTVNEARAREGMPPIPGGDLIFVPLNSVRGGGPQASPNSPTATPASDLEPAGSTPGGGTGPQGAASAQDILNGDYIVLGAKEAEKALEPDTTDLEHELFMVAHRATYEAQARQLLLKTFGRQRNVVDGGRDLKQDRWDRELSDDLYGLLLPAASTIGGDAAKRLGHEFDEARVSNTLRAKSNSLASDINTETSVTGDFSEERAESLAASTTEWLLSWAEERAIQQAEE